MNKLEARVDKLETEYRSKNGSQQQEEISPVIREAIEKLRNLKIGDEGTPEAEEWERRREERIRNWQPGEYGLLLLGRGGKSRRGYVY